MADRDGPEFGGVPRWVKVIGIVVAVVVVLVVLAQVTGIAGDHGPGRHLPGGQGPATSDGARVDGRGW